MGRGAPPGRRRPPGSAPCGTAAPRLFRRIIANAGPCTRHIPGLCGRAHKWPGALRPRRLAAPPSPLGYITIRNPTAPGALAPGRLAARCYAIAHPGRRRPGAPLGPRAFVAAPFSRFPPPCAFGAAWNRRGKSGVFGAGLAPGSLGWNGQGASPPPQFPKEGKAAGRLCDTLQVWSPV